MVHRSGRRPSVGRETNAREQVRQRSKAWSTPPYLFLAWSEIGSGCVEDLGGYCKENLPPGGRNRNNISPRREELVSIVEVTSSKCRLATCIRNQRHSIAWALRGIEFSSSGKHATVGQAGLHGSIDRVDEWTVHGGTALGIFDKAVRSEGEKWAGGCYVAAVDAGPEHIGCLG